MALPPEPLPDLLARAALVFEGRVSQAAIVGAPPPLIEAEVEAVDVGQQLPAQDVRLAITRALAGAAPSEVDAHKPAAPYDLQPGDQGVFFLERVGDEWVVIGRYGPDTYSAASVEAAVHAR